MTKWNTEKHIAWMSVLAPLIADALTGNEEERQLRARAATLRALTYFDVAFAELVQRDGTVSTGALLDEAFRILKPAMRSD